MHTSPLHAHHHPACPTSTHSPCVAIPPALQFPLRCTPPPPPPPPQVLHQRGRIEEVCKLAADAGVDIDMRAAQAATSVQQLESAIVVPAYGYRSLREYYDENSSTSAVSAVRTPLLVIGTRQDPLISEFMMEVPIAAARTNPNVLTVITRYGGHVGWLSSMQEDAWYMRLWFEFADSVQRMRAEDGRAAAVGVAASDAVSESCVEVSVVAGSSSADLEAAVQLATRSVGGCGPGSEPEVEAASAQRVLQVVVA
mmetsp:Transcript_40029/g.119212  ORF Transcript_40029/g.119212 Transcript_40029/m.119212 type:complete len:254 (-) Transcript_40029:1398-2159(-)